MLRVRTLFILSVTRVLSLLFYFILSLHFTPGLQSAVCSLQSAFYTDRYKNWTPVLEVTRKFRVNKKIQVQILRHQFPLRPAAAKTIHRCQGDTLNEAVIDFPASTREHMHYASLSRVRNSSTLHILNLNENKIKVSEKVKSEMSRLRTQVSLMPLAVLQTDNLHQTKTILFQNVRSLYLYIDDMRSDYNIQKSDVNIFVESKLCLLDRDDTYQVSEFTLYRIDFKVPLRRKSHPSNLSHFKTQTSSPYKSKNAVFCFQISLFVPEIFKFLKYAN